MLAKNIYKKSQDIINMEFSTIADKNKFIRQIDLYTIWGFDNVARATSLKSLEIAMNLELVEDMPIEHTQYVYDEHIQTILDYNKNDVIATNKFLDVTLGNTENSLYKNKDKIQLRKNLTKQFGYNVLNLPDIKIGEQLMLYLYSRETGINKHDLKKHNTKRDSISLSDCIPSWCKFETPEFNKLLTIFKNKVLNTSVGSKDSFKESVVFHNFKFDYGIGGLHGNIKPGVYEATKDKMILDMDIASLYPSLAEGLNLYPEHLGETFIKIYSGFIKKRLVEKAKPKNERNDVIIEGYKLMLNSVYGKSGSDTSFVYDRLYQLRTTIAGQLFLSMWCEQVAVLCPNTKFLMANTDGVTIIIDRDDYDKVMLIGEQLHKITGLVFEYAEYDKVVTRDVNNYASRYTDGKIKFKGCFEIDKEFHKDPSMRIVPLSLKAYFFDNIKPNDFIPNHKNIYDFCLRLKVNSSSTASLTKLENNKLVDEKLGKNTRYYISKNGGSLQKQFNNSGKKSGVNVGFGATVFNKYVSSDDYKINYQFYINEAYKIIDIVDDKQLTLF